MNNFTQKNATFLVGKTKKLLSTCEHELSIYPVDMDHINPLRMKSHAISFDHRKSPG